MAATPYRPVSWTDQNLSKEKLQQMANNEQWLFENNPKIRYNYSGAIIRDNGLKIIAGKSPFGTSGLDSIDTWVYFGNFFSAACKPIVTAVVETGGFWLRKFITIRGIGGEIDYRGFLAHLTTHENVVDNRVEASGWIHWTAVGF